MRVTAKGSEVFAEATAGLARKLPPQNQTACPADGRVLSAPAVAEALTGGSAGRSPGGRLCDGGEQRAGGRADHLGQLSTSAQAVALMRS